MDGRGFVPVELEARYVPLRLSISIDVIGVYDAKDIELSSDLGRLCKSDDWQVPEALTDALAERNISKQNLQREIDLVQQGRIAWRNPHPMPMIMTGELNEVWLQARQGHTLPARGLVYPEPWQYCTRALAQAIQPSENEYAIPTGGLSLLIEHYSSTYLQACYRVMASTAQGAVSLLTMAVCLKRCEQAESHWLSMVQKVTALDVVQISSRGIEDPCRSPVVCFGYLPKEQMHVLSQSATSGSSARQRHWRLSMPLQHGA